MRRRCQRGYGGGVRVSAEWEDYATFLADMGVRPPGTTLDRIDNSGNYCKGNCQWATATTQANNRRSNRNLTFQGKTLSVTAWARELGVPYATLFWRLNNEWPLERALQPTKTKTTATATSEEAA